MKIEIIIAEINEKTTGMTCFEAPSYIIDKIHHCRAIKGIVIIDDNTIKFSFSPYFMDGDIYTDNSAHALIIKHLLPLYVYNNFEQFKKVYAK